MSNKESLYHSILDYIITRAVVRGETGSIALTVPLKEIDPNPNHSDDINLLIMINSEWTEKDVSIPKFEKSDPSASLSEVDKLYNELDQDEDIEE